MANTLAISPADIIAYLLVERSLGSDPDDSVAWPVFANIAPDTPDNVVTVSDTTGTTSFRTMPDGATNEKYGIQVMVRGRTQPVTWVKIDEIQRDLTRGLYGFSFTQDSVSYTVKKLVLFSPIIRMGLEKPASKRFLYSLNFLALVEAETTGSYLLDSVSNFLADSQGNRLVGV